MIDRQRGYNTWCLVLSTRPGSLGHWSQKRLKQHGDDSRTGPSDRERVVKTDTYWGGVVVEMNGVVHFRMSAAGEQERWCVDWARSSRRGGNTGKLMRQHESTLA